VPLNRSTPVLYLNKNRFRAAGLDPNQPPRTWSEFREVARKLTTDPERSYGFGATSNSWFFETLVYGAGGDLVTSDGKTSAFAAAGAKPLQVWADMIHRDKTARVAGRDAFLRGEAAMSIESTALVSYYEAAANKFEVGTGFVPCLDGQRPGVATGGGVAVLPATLSPEKQQAAWQFLSSLAATMPTADLSRRTGYVPLRKSAVELLKKEGFYTEHPNFLTAVEQMQYARAMPIAPSWGSATYLITKAMTECLQKDVPADVALKGITPLFDQILLRNKAAMK
jgi:sn-glycerol 3-phosphate transport system substrate-binding protein